MKIILLTVSTALIAFSGVASAACSGTPLDANQLSTLLTGNTVCVQSGGGGWEAQEQHLSGGTLRDYKLGSSSSTDPTETIGTWSITGTGGAAKVNYNYTGGSSFVYSVYGSGIVGQPHSFCGATNVDAIKVMAGLGPCN